MRYQSKLIIVTTCLVLGACLQPPLVVGQVGPSLAPEEVTVYYIDRPRCSFETVAMLRSEGGYFSLASTLESMRRQAAEIGANGLYVLHTQRSEMKEYFATARAIRCLSA